MAHMVYLFDREGPEHQQRTGAIEAVPWSMLNSPPSAGPPRSIIDACREGNLNDAVEFMKASTPTAETLSQCFRVVCFHSQRADILNYLFENGAKINNSDIGGIVRQIKSLDIYATLLEHGWDINSEVGHEGEGTTALMSVVHDERMVKWFLEKGADPGLGPPDGEVSGPLTPDTGHVLDAAARQRSAVSTIDLLLEHGAKLEKSYALHVAVSRTDGMPLMRHLIGIGADVNQYHRSMYHFAHGTPLEHAVRAENVENVRFLLLSGADPLFKRTPLAPSSLEIADGRCTNPVILDLMKAFAHEYRKKERAPGLADTSQLKTCVPMTPQLLSSMQDSTPGCTACSKVEMQRTRRNNEVHMDRCPKPGTINPPSVRELYWLGRSLPLPSSQMEINKLSMFSSSCPVSTVPPESESSQPSIERASRLPIRGPLT